MKAKEESRTGPLSNVRILDLGTMIAGPVAGTLLADFGATVVKVEKPDGGDTLRHIGPFYKGESLYWNVDGRNKRSITLDLRTQKGQHILKSLVKNFDAVVENFRPGTLEKWDLGYESLSKINPKLIMLSVSGFGQTGPYASRAAYDRIATAFGGLLNITGFSDRPPVRIGVSMADYLTALFGAFSLTMALYNRDVNSSQGQHIDLSLYETVFRFTESLAASFQKLGVARERAGNLGFAAAPGDHFKTSDGRYIVLTISNNALFEKLCNIMERHDLISDPRFCSHQLRWENIDDINNIVASWILTHDVSALIQKLDGARLAYSMIYSISDIFQDEHYKFRESIQTVTTKRLGDLMMPGVAAKFSKTPAPPLNSAPDLGEHNFDVYSELLGLSNAEIENLKKAGII